MTDAPYPRPGNRETVRRAYDGHLAVWRWGKHPEPEEDERPRYCWLLVDVTEDANAVTRGTPR